VTVEIVITCGWRSVPFSCILRWKYSRKTVH
jgi:hypothetical protein